MEEHIRERNELSRSIKPTTRITTTKTSIGFMRGTSMRGKARFETTTRNGGMTQGTTSTGNMLGPISGRKRRTIIIMSRWRKNLISSFKDARSSGRRRRSYTGSNAIREG